MKLHFDEEADAIYLRLDDSKIIESEKISPGIVLDFNEHNGVRSSRVLAGACAGRRAAEGRGLRWRGAKRPRQRPA